MNKIPKIIHQIWSGIDGPLPEQFEVFSQTWKECYPDWKHISWNNEMINDFIRSYYPEYWDVYTGFHYNIQRWDAIRYLILYKYGGMYVDYDYESLESMEVWLKDKECCFSMEPEIHSPRLGEAFFNNAMIISVSNHFFMKKIISYVFSEETLLFDWHDKGPCIMNTAGPEMLIKMYKELSNEEKEQIFLIPAKNVSPFDRYQLRRLRCGERSEELEQCLDDAYAVHYFFNTWV